LAKNELKAKRKFVSMVN